MDDSKPTSIKANGGNAIDSAIKSFCDCRDKDSKLGASLVGRGFVWPSERRAEQQILLEHVPSPPPPISCPHALTHTHTRTRAHTQRNTHTYTHTHTRTHTNTHTHTHPHAPKHTHTHSHTLTHRETHPHSLRHTETGPPKPFARSTCTDTQLNLEVPPSLGYRYERFEKRKGRKISRRTKVSAKMCHSSHGFQIDVIKKRSGSLIMFLSEKTRHSSHSRKSRKRKPQLDSASAIRCPWLLEGGGSEQKDVSQRRLV